MILRWRDYLLNHVGLMVCSMSLYNIFLLRLFFSNVLVIFPFLIYNANFEYHLVCLLIVSHRLVHYCFEFLPRLEAIILMKTLQ